MGQQADIHTKILNSQSTDELMGVYDGWAERYDRELLDDWGYSSPERAVTALAAHIPWRIRPYSMLAAARVLWESFYRTATVPASMASTIQRACWPKLRKKRFTAACRVWI